MARSGRCPRRMWRWLRVCRRELSYREVRNWLVVLLLSAPIIVWGVLWTRWTG